MVMGKVNLQAMFRAGGEGPVFHNSGPLTTKIATLKVKTDLNLQNKI